MEFFNKRLRGILTFTLIMTSFLLMQTACSIEASLTSLNEVILQRGSILNTAVTSDQKALTIENQFHVQSSSGSMTDQIVQKTQKGYTVFVSTQGAMLPVK
ncbi:MAG: hypothetical protein ACXWRE_03540 [Pseudobdellovibrionaceae bacterium]